MTIIFVRHGKKEYNNGGAPNYSHDPPLTQEGKEECSDVSLCMQSYGFPETVIMSPYLRTRQTTEGLIKGLKDLPDIIVDNRIAESLINQRGKILLYPETEAYDPPTSEHSIDVKERVKDFYLDIIRDHQDRVIWVVTHGIIIDFISRLHYGEKYKPQPLEFLVIE